MAREPFNDVWANAPSNPGNDASFIEPRAVIFDTGWEGGADKDAPKAGEQNWWQNRADSAMQDIERYGVMTWDADAIYAAGAPVRATDSNYYESLANSNTGNNPTSTSGSWRLLGSSLYSVVPVGSGVLVYHNGVPDTGWLKCNGSVLLRASYPRLFAAIGTIHNTGGEATTQFRLPDMRGEFPRGWDDGRGVDTSRVLGSAQTGDVQAHTHLAPTTVSAATGTFEVPGVGYNAYDYINAAPTSSTGGTETRPRNKAVNFWIKY